jgi:hypothetical protein
MSKSTPKAPDYAAAAQQQGQASKEITEQQTWANRPDQNTPWGSTTWQNQQVWDPTTNQYINKWTQDTTLNEQSQRALDAQMGLTTGRSELGAGMMDRARDEFGQEMDWSKFQQGGQAVQAPGGPQAGDIQRGISTEGLTELDPSQRYYQQANEAIYNQWADRALPQQERDTDRLRTQLYNMGLKEGDSAYDTEMERMRQAQGDAQRQAQYQATIGAGSEAQRMLGMDAATRGQMFGERMGQGQFGNQAQAQDWGQQLAGQNQNFNQQMQASQYQTQLRQQQIAEEMQKRGFSLNEINALISGQQVAMPNMPGFNTASKSETPNMLGAAQMQGQSDLDRFNAQQAAMQGMMSGIGSMAGGFMMSDRRFKRGIVRVGSTAGGTPLYKFRYIFGGPEMVGVMADEVPHAVTKIAGISFVDYSKVK